MFVAASGSWRCEGFKDPRMQAWPFPARKQKKMTTLPVTEPEVVSATRIEIWRFSDDEGGGAVSRKRRWSSAAVGYQARDWEKSERKGKKTNKSAKLKPRIVEAREVEEGLERVEGLGDDRNLVLPQWSGGGHSCHSSQNSRPTRS